MEVVIADDDESQRLLLSSLVKQQGFDPVPVDSGDAALAHLQSTECCIILCDIEMPGMDGLATTRAIRRMISNRYVYVLLVTSRTSAEELVEGLEAGADDFMSKPPRPAELRVRLAGAARLIKYDEQLRRSRADLQQAYARVWADLKAAAQAQRRLLPPGQLVTRGVTASSAFRPSGEVSGDMFGYCSLGDGIVGVYCADVAGHGVRAALMAVTLGHMLAPVEFARLVGQQRPWLPGRHFDTSRIPTVLNERFCDELAVEDYFALTVAVVNSDTCTVSLCQAGQPRPLLIGPDRSLTFLGEGGYPVGLLATASFETFDYEMPKGAKLLLYSDGLSEAEDPLGAPFGEEGIAAAIAEGLDAGLDLLDHLLHAVQQWTETSQLVDDLSMILLEV